MAEWSRNKVDPSTINNGNEYTKNDQVSLQNLNAVVNSGLYAQDFAEHLADEPDTSGANQIGTPNVEFVDNVVGGKTYKKFKFSNLKGESGINGVPSYDLNITTQQEFEDFYTKLDNGTLTAHSVLFVGNGGELEFTRSDGKGLKLPATLYQISGVNNAIINISGITSSGAIYYTSPITTQNDEYSISNLHIKYVSLDTGIGVRFCNNIRNCTIEAMTSSNAVHQVMHHCNNISNCIITGNTSTKNLVGCFQCNNIINCSVTLTSENETTNTTERSVFGFNLCDNLVNCSASVSTKTDYASGFNSCDFISNCSATVSTVNFTIARGFSRCSQLTNCSSSATATNSGTADENIGCYGFYNCSYNVLPKEGSEPNTTALIGGTSEKTILNAGSLPIGMILSSALPQDDAGLRLLDGSTIPQDGMYAEFCTYLKKVAETYPQILCTQDEFNNDITTYGQCGRFVIDDTAKTIRLPLITEFIASNNGGQTIGLAQLDEFKHHRHDVYIAEGSLTTWGLIIGKSSYGFDQNAIADAGGTETRPKNVRYPYYIVLANSVKTDVQVNIDNVASDVNNLSNRIETVDNTLPKSWNWATLNTALCSSGECMWTRIGKLVIGHVQDLKPSSNDLPNDSLLFSGLPKNIGGKAPIGVATAFGLTGVLRWKVENNDTAIRIHWGGGSAATGGNGYYFDFMYIGE